MNRFLYDTASYASFCAFKLLFRVRRTGLEQVPVTGPLIIVANHTSYFDPPLIGCTVRRRRRTHFFARSSLGKNRFIAWYLQCLGTLFVDRDGHARAGLDLGIKALEQAGALTLFPEGTRSRDGRVGPFKRGLLLMLKKVPSTQVVPSGIRGAHRAFARSGKLPRIFSPIEVHYGEPMSAADVLAPGGLEELRRRVRELCGEDEPVGSARASARLEKTQAPGELPASACIAVDPQTNPQADLQLASSPAVQVTCTNSPSHAGEPAVQTDIRDSKSSIAGVPALVFTHLPAVGWSGRGAVASSDVVAALPFN